MIDNRNDNPYNDYETIYIKCERSSNFGIPPGYFSGLIVIGILIGLQYIWNLLADLESYTGLTKIVVTFYHYTLYEPISFGKSINNYFIYQPLTEYSKINFIVRWSIVIFYYFGVLPYLYRKLLKIFQKFNISKNKFKLLFLAPLILLILKVFLTYIFS
ncbi:hypothetical protein OZX61_12755 (plasmid) [Acinetobacter sp. ESL0695]|uniref:hypothetical protein n=1 Tax=Acinetobacter sp. ESL0695 TaxID=2983215 RepID=UPI0023F09FF3|nr:hypothetical protein [Acinetobacter sp. ESL0695]WEV50212.1 hypothetical protein OZX61_12755 [Acinetobacter sp. ESL0695]